MDKTIRRVTDLKEQRMETYRYWRSRSVAERMEAVAEIARDAYSVKESIWSPGRPTRPSSVSKARPGSQSSFEGKC